MLVGGYTTTTIVQLSATGVLRLLADGWPVGLSIGPAGCGRCDETRCGKDNATGFGL